MQFEDFEIVIAEEILLHKKLGRTLLTAMF